MFQRGQKSKHLPKKRAEFCISFSSDWGKVGQSLGGGGRRNAPFPPPMPPLNIPVLLHTNT